MSSTGNIARLVVVAEGNPACCAVAIVDLDGHVRARRTFKPPPQALVGCEGSWVYAPIQVAGNAAYYMARPAEVRDLGISGTFLGVLQGG